MHDTAPADETERYQIGECIGRGGLGSVYRAWDARLGRWVAIKRLHIDAGQAPEDPHAKLRVEANALAALQHPNVVTIHDFGSDEQGPFVIMEFVEGRTLAECVENAPFDCASFLDMAEQMLAGVSAAHRAGMLHRDLKPGNVMLTALAAGSFQVKILDFGLAKFAAHPMEQTVDNANTLLGSIYFMAPEQFRRAPIDARTDLYSLGCMFYYTLTGFHPFTGDTVASTMASHLQHEVRDLATLRRDVPEAVSAWVMQLLSLDPADRPASAAAALVSLRAASHRAGPNAGDEAARKPPTRRFPMPAVRNALLSFTALGAAVGGYMIWNAGAGSKTAKRPAALPSVSLFASIPVAHARSGVPGCFTIVRTGDESAPLPVSYMIHGSAKNGIDYAELAKTRTIKPGAASEKIPIVPIGGTHQGAEDRHVKLTLVPSSAYTVATPEEVKVKIIYDH